MKRRVFISTLLINVYAVRIIEQPQDQFIREGGIATFSCGYNESINFPHWLINDAIFTTQGLPRRHTYTNQRLTVNPVQASDDGSTYKCIFTAGVSSRKAILLVVRTTTRPTTGRSSEAATALPTTSQSPDATSTSASASSTSAGTFVPVKTTTDATDDDNTNHVITIPPATRVDATTQDISIISIVSATCGGIILLFLTACLSTMAFIIIKHQRPRQLDVAATGQDDTAYEEIGQNPPGISSCVENLPTLVQGEHLAETISMKGNACYEHTMEPIYTEIEEKVDLTTNTAYQTCRCSNKEKIPAEDKVDHKITPSPDPTGKRRSVIAE